MFILRLIDIILHVDKYLVTIVNDYAALTYGIIFAVIFVETGFIIFPFLPGDSLLFASGALAGIGTLNIWFVYLTIVAGAVIGDTVNYYIGKHIGPKIFNKESSLFFRKEYLIRAELFYEKYGKKTIILSRFVPIIRTFAPFVAGIGRMSYRVFLFYNIIGALLWTGLFVFGGFAFGNIPWVKEHFGLIVIGIILISLVPLVKEVVFHFFFSKKETKKDV